MAATSCRKAGGEQTGSPFRAGGIGHRKLRDVQAVTLEERRQDQLAAPSLPVLGEHHPRRLRLALVAAERSEGPVDLLHPNVDAELLGQQAAQPQRIRRRVALGHEQAEDALRTERAGREGGHHRAVDPARQAHDDPATAQVAQDDPAQEHGDALDLRAGVDAEHVS